jgi:antitoxin (DNA-binding transcriptional repressor) of toxin-antitoxin stability system
MVVQVNVYEAKTNLSRLLEQVLAGERVIISKSGKPIVDMVRHRGFVVTIGGLRGQIEYDDADFESTDADIAAMFYGNDAAS